MKQGCEAFVEGWEQEIEKVLIERSDDENETVNLMCNIISQVKL